MKKPIIYEALPGQPHIEPIVHWRGDTFMYQIYGYVPDAEGGLGPNGNYGPMNWLGYEFHMQIRDECDNLIVDIGDECFSIRDGNGEDDVLLIEKTDEAFTEQGQWKYDIEFRDIGSRVMTFQAGEFIANPDTTWPVEE